jgi:hypothetical protein
MAWARGAAGAFACSGAVGPVWCPAVGSILVANAWREAFSFVSIARRIERRFLNLILDCLTALDQHTQPDKPLGFSTGSGRHRIAEIMRVETGGSSSFRIRCLSWVRLSHGALLLLLVCVVDAGGGGYLASARIDRADVQKSPRRRDQSRAGRWRASSGAPACWCWRVLASAFPPTFQLLYRDQSGTDPADGHVAQLDDPLYAARVASVKS